MKIAITRQNVAVEDRMVADPFWERFLNVAVTLIKDAPALRRRRMKDEPTLQNSNLQKSYSFSHSPISRLGSPKVYNSRTTSSR